MDNNMRGIISSRTLILLIGAALLCAIGLTGAVGATQAQLNYSEDYAARIQQTDLGVALLEKSGKSENAVTVNVGDEGASIQTDVVAEGTIKATLLAQTDEDGQQLVLGGDKQMIPGKKYTEEISAQNVSANNEYLRLTVKKYWMVNGEKTYELNPALIKLGRETGTNGWMLASEDDETLVFYYKPMVEAGQITPAAITDISLDRNVIDAKNQLIELLKTKAIQTANYDGTETDTSMPELTICLEAKVEAVQTKHVADAAKSAWGVDISALGLTWGNTDENNGSEA